MTSEANPARTLSDVSNGAPQDVFVFGADDQIQGKERTENSLSTDQAIGKPGGVAPTTHSMSQRNVADSHRCFASASQSAPEIFPQQSHERSLLSHAGIRCSDHEHSLPLNHADPQRCTCSKCEDSVYCSRLPESRAKCNHLTVFGPNAPRLSQSEGSSSDHSNSVTATPKRPREPVAVDEITALLAECRMDLHVIDDIDQATDMLAHFHMPEKRPRVERDSDLCEDPSEPNISSSSSPAKLSRRAVACEDFESDGTEKVEGGCHPTAKTQREANIDVSVASPADAFCHPSSDGDLEECHSELCFLVTHCDIHSDPHSSHFMPYIT